MAQRRQRLFLGLLLVIHTALLVWLARTHSPNLNEPAHLVAGLSHWEYGTFTLYRVNPPLVRMAAALPVWLHGYTPNWSDYRDGLGVRPESVMGERFVGVNGPDIFWLVTLGRLACIPFSLIGLTVCYLWARDLFGGVAGLMAATLWCFSPMILGHAAMFTPDAHSAALGLAACYTFWLWLKTPTWRQAILTGAVLGIAELSKTTLIVFYPLWPLLWVLYRWPDRHRMNWRRWRDEAGMLLLRMVVGLYVLNLGYLADGSFTPLKDYQFVSKMLVGDPDAVAQPSGDRSAQPSGDRSVLRHNRFADRWWAAIPIPLPKDYVLGIDLQQRDFESTYRLSYLRGQFQPQGWWYYYLYAIAVKAPLGTLGLGCLAFLVACTPLRARLPRRDWMILLVPALVVLGIASAKYGINRHSRYILPCIPLAFIAISSLGRQIELGAIGLVTAFRRSRHRDSLPAIGRRRGRQHCIVGFLAAGMLLATVASSLRAFPHCMGYFHELVGGPAGGPNHLLGSNVDWGQDLLFLRDWIEAQPVSADGDHGDQAAAPVFLAFDNGYNPFVLGIQRLQPWPFRKYPDRLPESIPDGDYAISVNQLYGHPRSLRSVSGQHYEIDPRPLAALRKRQPIARAGYSVWIYSAAQLREAYAESVGF